MLFDKELKVLETRGLIDLRIVVEARPHGYTWRELTDETWFPEPRASDAHS